MTKSEIDRLGDRLRKGAFSDDDLRLLDTYRLSFSSAYEHVIKLLRDDLKLQPTGRPAKSTPSIVDKLRRESIRLTQIQDIAGCRVVVENLAEQDRIISQIRDKFTQVSVIDRREKPSHGYRAIHVIVRIAEEPVEIQVRTALQHLWAELSEKMSDVSDPTIKYGGGSDIERSILSDAGSLIADVENRELPQLREQLVQLLQKWVEKLTQKRA